MKMAKLLDYTTKEGIDHAERNLEEFAESVERCITRDMLPWGLIINCRAIRIAEARQALASKVPA
jgi:hypothetical protein